MQRLIVVYNPSSSRFGDVKKEVLEKVKSLNGYLVGKYEIKKTTLEKNVDNLAGILEDGDLVISAGGDATGVISVNGILKSEKDVKLAVLPYGNFNDLANTLKTRRIEDIFSTKARTVKFYPLQIVVDGKLFRYATCYVTIGMTAEAVYIYDQPKMRKKLKKSFGRAVSSYTELAGWYFKNRHKKKFLPEFRLNGKIQDARSSDYAAVNGSSMARVMKGGKDYLDKKMFRSEVDRLVSLWRLVRLMTRSMFVRVPGNETKGDVIEFCQPAKVGVQAEGEYRLFGGVKKIEIRKGEECLKVIKI